MPRNKTLGELLSMLKEAEPEINKGKKKESHLTQTSKKGPKKRKKKKTPTGPSGGVRKTKGQAASGKQVAGDRSQDVCLHYGKWGH